MDLPPPSVLTQLPRPLQASTGRTQAGEVFTLVDSRKRKRHEVAVAVDGEGINIYNVQFPKLVTSYAVPPQSEFSCCPISIRLRDKESTAVKRYTYCAIQRPQFQIKGFFEETVAGSSAAPTISSSSHALNNSRSPVIYIGVIPATSSGSDSTSLFDLLVVHRDGLVRRLTQNLETEKWSAETSGSGSEEIAYAFLVDHEDARRALFRRRPDLAGLIVDDLSSSVGNVSSVLLLVAQAKDSLATMIYMFSVTANVVASGHSLRSSTKLQNLETAQLPSNEEPSLDVKDIQWSFHPGSAGLGLSFPRGYMNYDLSQFPPSRTSSMIIADEEFSSMMRISPNSVIGAGKSSVAVYDTLYSSIQRNIPLRELPTSKSHGKSTSKTSLKFVGYFAKLGIALAIKENSLQAFDLSSTLSIRGTSVKRQRDGLLIDAIGRGVNLSSAGVNDPAHTLGLKSAQEVHKWNAFKSEVDKACKSKDGLAFDEAIVKRFGPSVEAQAVTDVHPEQITFILSRIFTVRQQDSSDLRRTSSQLEIVVWPEKTCKWLAKLGQLSTDHVKAAVLRANKPSILAPFEPGTVTRALAEFDTSLKVLTLMLSSSGLLDREELVHTLRIFLDEARARSAAIDLSSTMAISGIPNAEASADGTTSLQPAPASTASGGASLEDAFIGLNLTLARLHDYPTNQIISSFRSTLSNTDTLAIIHHLRVSLATGGYTARFTEEPPVPLEAIKAAPPLSLEAIIDLMNASVDAIGPSGWISAVEFAGAAVNEIEMISHMQSEISAALAGIEEAAYMKGIVGEFVRYGYRVSKSTSSSTSLETGATSNATAAVTISAKDITMTNGDYDATSTTITNPSSLARINREYDSYGKLWETHTFPKAGEEDGKMLPLSLNTPESEVSRTKIQKSTGEVKQRSKREIAYLQRQAVPDYSVVRIHL